MFSLFKSHWTQTPWTWPQACFQREGGGQARMATLRDQAKTSIPRVIRNSVSSLSGGQSNSLGIPLQASLLKNPLLAVQKLTVSNCPARCREGEAGAWASQRCDQGPQHPGVSSQRETCEPPYIHTHLYPIQVHDEDDIDCWHPHLQLNCFYWQNIWQNTWEFIIVKKISIFWMKASLWTNLRTFMFNTTNWRQNKYFAREDFVTSWVKNNHNRDFGNLKILSYSALNVYLHELYPNCLHRWGQS